MSKAVVTHKGCSGCARRRAAMLKWREQASERGRQVRQSIERRRAELMARITGLNSADVSHDEG